MKASQTGKRRRKSAMINFVNAQAVWQFLEVEQDFETWIADRITNYPFVKGDDYIIVVTISQAPVAGMLGGTYVISFDMAMELALLENTPKAREIRRLCIERVKPKKTPRRPAR